MNDEMIRQLLINNNISAEKLEEYITKAALYDAIVNYCELAEYPQVSEILAFCGERVEKVQKEGEKDEF